MLVLDSYTWEKKGWEAFVLPTTLRRKQSMKQGPRKQGRCVWVCTPTMPDGILGQHLNCNGRLNPCLVNTNFFTYRVSHYKPNTWKSFLRVMFRSRGLQFPWVIHGDPTPHDGTLVHLSSEALKGFFWLFHHRETNRISTRIVPSMAFLSMSDLKLTSATASMKIASLILPNHAHSNFLMSCSNKREGIDKPGSKREQSWTSKVKHEDSSPS